MKSRKLKKIIGEATGGFSDRYTFHEQRKNICIGSSFCSDLFTVNKETLKVRYALNISGEIENDFPEGKIIVKTLRELVSNNKIKDIIEGHDDIKKKDRIPVFYIEKSKLVESYCEEFGYPYVTFDGHKMYENTDFRTKKEAIDSGIEDIGYRLTSIEEHKEMLSDDLDKLDTRQDKAVFDMAELKKQLAELS